MRQLLTICAAVAMLGLSAAPSRAATEITWWHGLAGPLGEWIDDLANGFNESQTEYVIVPVFKGDYAESITAAIAAYRTNTQPHILLVPTYATAQFMRRRVPSSPFMN
jgi:sn-glycerol 3-phosphate transport system substrate-binding protein